MLMPQWLLMAERIHLTCLCLVKAKTVGLNYIYSVLLGYEDPPRRYILDDGVYYNKYMIGNKIKMSTPL